MAVALFLFLALLPSLAPAGDSPAFTDSERAHWAFQPVARPAIPLPADPSRVRTPIDAFVLDKLNEHGLDFSPGVGKQAFIRRATLDLTGLLPTPDEVDRFVEDDSTEAYEKLIDCLLASPHYGEACGRDWLDLVRFAETAGFNADPLRPLAWKYRDYVVRAFNNDTPFDRFIEQQLAGDELFPDDVEALIATGYNRLWPDESNSSDVLLSRQDALNDLTANVGAVFLGLSIGCAQCHDHKFDPLPQRDFYRLQAFFAGIVPRDRTLIGTGEELERYERTLHAWLDETALLRNELRAIEHTARSRAGAEKRRKFPEIVLDAIDTPPDVRTALQQQLVFWSERQIVVTEKDMNAQMSEEQKQRRGQLRTQLMPLNKKRPRPPAEVDVMAAISIPGKQPKTFLLEGGNYQKQGEELQPGFLSILPGSAAGTPKSRADLAKWLVDPANPLTARVMANRVWQSHFGRGLVENANDFGVQSPPPTHPELLDWLASELVARGWSLKSMHRLIMTSEVYRQGAGNGQSVAAERGFTADPENRLFWRFPRRRLSAERIRDTMLVASGQLNLQMGGPGVRPPLPAALGRRDSWKVSEPNADHHRRSVYIFAKRNLPYPLLQAFDSPDMHESCARRESTTIAPQALFLLNSDETLGCARTFAERLLHESSQIENAPAAPDGTSSRAALIQHAYRIAYGRSPEESEQRDALEFLTSQGRLVDERSAVVDFCHALLNANEFLCIE